jgi:hypothetical protein
MVTLLTFDGVEDVDYTPSDSACDGDSGCGRLVLGRRWLRRPRVLVPRAGVRAGRGACDVRRWLCG